MIEKRFAEGIYFNEKSDRDKDFVLGSISVNAEKFVAWISGEDQDEKGYIRLKILKAKQTGKPYVEVDTWRPNSHSTESKEEVPIKEDIPTIGIDGEEVPF